MKKTLFIFICSIFLFSQVSFAKGTQQKNQFNKNAQETQCLNGNSVCPWSVLFYIGRTAKEPIGRVIKGQFTSVNETLYTGEFAYTLSQQNPVVHFLRYILSQIQLAGNVTIRDGKYNKSTIYEFDPYIIFRWTHFPWHNYLNTTFGAAEGVSYVTEVPWVEKRYNDDCSRFLNYLMFELTFALPSYPRAQLVVRLHHRSGGYGLYGAGNTGSNAVGLGFRYYFGM